MKRLSIGDVWLESHAFVKREIGLLLPVALLFIGVPLALMFSIVPPEMRQMSVDAAVEPAAVSGGVSFAMLVLLVFVMFGVMVLYTLALKGGISLGEALRHAMRRLPVALGANLLVAVAVVVPTLLLASVNARIATLLMVMAFGLLSAKLLTINAFVIDTELRPIAALKAAWKSTNGAMGRILLFLIVIAIAIMLAQMTAQILSYLLGMALGGQTGAMHAASIGVAAVLAIGQVYMVVMVTRIYRRLVER